MSELRKNTSGTVHVLLEQFNHEIQWEIDKFNDDKISLTELMAEYNRRGTEKAEVDAYSNLLSQI